MYRLATLTALTLTFFLTALPSFAQVARFERLGSLEGGVGSIARGLSADGSTVVGEAAAADGGSALAFRWQDGEMEAYDRVPGEEGSVHRAWAASADGSIVVGGSAHGIAVRWENGEMRVIHDPERCEATFPQDVTSDGSIVVGRCYHSEGDGLEAARWVDGEIEGLGWLPDASEEFSYAEAISSDGSTIVGSSRNEVWPRQSAFRWTEQNGSMEDLCPEQDWCSVARAVSTDGSVIAGDSGFGQSLPTQEVPWRWEESVGAQALALPTGWLGASVGDVSADGSIIVGTGFEEIPEGIIQRAYLWTEEAGMQDLWEVLEEDYDLDLSGWGPITFATGISDDGGVIVGSAVNPDGILEGFRVEAPFGQPIADEATPEALADVLSAPSPNPVHGTSTFTVAVERGQHVSVEVFDALGRQVQTVYDGAFAAGMSETLTLDVSALPAGVYIVRATGEDFVKSRRMTVVR